MTSANQLEVEESQISNNAGLVLFAGLLGDHAMLLNMNN